MLNDETKLNDEINHIDGKHDNAMCASVRYPGHTLASLESMYILPDLSDVENEILHAAAQPLGAKIAILGVLAQPLAWRKGVAHNDGNSWHTAGLHFCPARYMPGQYPEL